MKNIKQNSNYVLEQNCKYCGELILGSTADKNFCTQTCLLKYHFERKEDIDTENLAKIYISSFGEKDEVKQTTIKEEVLAILEQKHKPREVKKFHQYLALFAQLKKLIALTEQFFQLWSTSKLQMKDLKEADLKLSEISWEVGQIGKMEFMRVLIDMDFFITFVRNKISEMQMMKKTKKYVSIPVEFKNELIPFHAKLLKKMEVY